jgi:tetratricopeptide (TPR) repeat protein
MSSKETDVLVVRLERAQALIEFGRLDDAAALLRELLGSEPNSAPAWALLAQAEIGLGDPKAGLDAAERAAALEPESDAPHRLRSIAMQQLGDDEGAVSAARAAVTLAPHNWQTHSRLAIALGVAKQDLDDALASAERGVELAPGVPATHYALGVVNDRMGKHAEAESCFRKALSLDPQHGPSHSALAARRLSTSRFGRAGNLAAAAGGFREAVQADPRASYSARNLELVLKVFLARLSYLIFVIVWIASRVTGSTVGARILPLLLLAIPAAFAVRFLARLAPDLRRHVYYIAFHGRLAAASIAQACAVALLFVSAAAPSGARTGLGIAALVASLIARVLLAYQPGKALLSAGSKRVIVAAVILTILFFAGATVGGGFQPARGLLFDLLAVGGALLYYRLRRRRA